MKVIIVVALCLVALAAAAPADPKLVQIVRSDFQQEPEGSYIFSFENDDGTSRNEKGELKETLDEENKPHSVITVRGSYSYTNSEGKVVTVSYYADETGFHAEGDDIPK